MCSRTGGAGYLDTDEIAESADIDGVFDAWHADHDSELDRRGRKHEVADRTG